MTAPRQFIRWDGGTSVAPIDFATAVGEALAGGDAVDFFDAGAGAEPTLVFRLQRRGIATVVVTPNGRHLATFSDPTAATWHGFVLLDRAAEQHRHATPPCRARRRLKKEARAR